jgi:putative thiamine transport system permease protein
MVLLFLLPLASSLVLLLPGLTDTASFVAALQHPQFTGALALTLQTGIISTLLALIFAIVILSSVQASASQQAAWFLAVPHLALAVGLGFLIAPTGLLARAIATLITGWTTPPNWQTVQDPNGVGLVLALVLKETPFLVWAMAQVLTQEELRQRFSRETAVAKSLGHGPRSTFMRVTLPQVLQRITWPIIAVFSYGLTVVDMALVIGPGQPPTLAQLAWTDLNDGETTMAARGAAATLMLSATVVAGIVAVGMIMGLCRPWLRRWLTAAPNPERSLLVTGTWLWRVWLGVYALVIMALLVQSVSLHWPFPQLAASEFSMQSWLRLLSDNKALLTTLVLAFATSVTALALSVLWFECHSRDWDRWALVAVTVILSLPALLLAIGQYRLLLQLGWTGTAKGLFLAHMPFVTAYVFTMLQGPYRAYDQRWSQASCGLGAARFKFLQQVKWPMLKAPLASALAVGFAVSVAQFVPSQLAAAGRYTTLPMETVTLTAGGNRSLIAVAALLLMVLPLLAFQLATIAGRPRWRT